MSDKNLILTLAKVIIAAAWADGEINLDEINSLKDLLYWLPQTGYKQGTQINGREWAMLEMYMKSPVGVEERTRLVEELQAALRTPKDRELAVSALDELIKADGIVTDEEVAVAQEIKSAINKVDLSIIGQIGRLVRGPVQRRSSAVANAPNREEHLEDFIKNRVYYLVQQRLDLEDADLNIPDTDLRKLSLAGGLMARVAHVDKEISDDEFGIMVNALQSGWDIGPEAAALVAEVATSEVSADLDYYRLTREFFTNTSQGERVRFLDVLFTVATASGEISHAENEEIRRISKSLNLSQHQFRDAKLKVIENQSDI